MGYDPNGTWNWGGFILGFGIVAATVITVATFGVGSAAGAMVAMAAIATGTTMMAAAATDSTLVIDASIRLSDGTNTMSAGVSLVIDFDSGGAELYHHVGIAEGNSSGITYSTGIVSNYDGYESYSGAFVQGGVNFMGVGVNHCFDPIVTDHKDAVQATTITFGSPNQLFGYGHGFDWYFSPIRLH